jgi:hypothetical protein
MIPGFMPNGNLPRGIYKTSWEEFCKRFGYTPQRKGLLEGLAAALKDLSRAGRNMDKETGDPKGIIASELGGFDD